VASLLNQLLHDAERRAAEIAREFASLKGQVPAEVESYRDKMEQRAVRCRDIVTKALSDPDVENPVLAVNYYRDYKDVARLVQSLEHLPLLVLRRFVTVHTPGSSEGPGWPARWAWTVAVR